jgi:hypothetical protein
VKIAFKKIGVEKRIHSMDIVKRITRVFCGVAIAGILFIGCENFDGPEPFLRDPIIPPVTQLVMASGESFPLESVLLIQITSAGIVVFVPSTDPASPLPVQVPIDIASVGKITFQ